MLRFGPDDGPIAIVALPLFEEANRTRAFAVAICRALAERGIGSVLPDMPGQGESLAPLSALSLLAMQTAYEGLVDALGMEARPCYGVALRSGALLDVLGLLHGRWHLAPQTGDALLRELKRMRQAQRGSAGPIGDIWWFDGETLSDGTEPPVDIAGNLLSTDLLTGLLAAEPYDQPGIPRRTLRLADDLAHADRHVIGAPLWRRSEPDVDSALARILAEDIADWIATCAA